MRVIRYHSFPARRLFYFQLFLCFCILYLGGQVIFLPQLLAQKHADYPKGYFMFPIKPGQANFLTGNMGELRSNHFHGGLDIRTEGREGLPIYSAADGYVSRIKVTTGGYGNALYITHPNGYVTVYGHIRNYNKVIGGFLRRQQYNSKSFEIDVLPNRDLLKVKKGEIVAYSGNTGGSGGPHLHFEIRDTLDNLLNPLYFGFDEIKDHIPPTVTKLALRPLDIHGRVDGEFARTEFILQKTGASHYSIAQPIPVWGQIGLEILAFDMSDGTQNKNGVTCMEVKLDDKEIYTHHLEMLSFDVSKHINLHIDYEHAYNTSNKFQRLYIADGNRLAIYKTDERKGKITIRDNKPHKVTISLWDAHQNKSTCSFTLQGTSPSSTVAPFKAVSSQATVVQTVLSENVLKIIAKNPKDIDGTALVFVGKKSFVLPVSYTNSNQAIYLWDMRRALPDSIQLQETVQYFDFKKMVPAYQEVLFERDSLSIQFPARSLFDTLYLEVYRKGDIFTVGKPVVPMQESIDIRFVPGKPVAAEHKMRTGVYAVSGKSLSYRGGIWVNDQLSFKTREFGRFTVAADTVAPVVKLESKTLDKISCKITDNLSGIYSFKASLDGEWLLMQYDYKRNLIWSDPLDETKPLQGKFVLEVADNAGNSTIFETTL